MQRLVKISSYYNKCALIFFNTFIIFVLINIVLFFVFWAIEKPEVKKTVVSNKGKEYWSKIYPGLTEQEIAGLRSETWSRPFVFEPYTQFKERPYKGKYVNVDINGFRIIKNQGPWPPLSQYFNIFIFGGSTTFGYEVSDDQTIPSYIQEFFEQNKITKIIRVYNFGRGYYYSTQELILFSRLVTSKFVPDMAIFIDGLNEFYNCDDQPIFTEEFKDFLEVVGREEIGKAFFFSEVLSKIPICKLARKLGGYPKNFNKDNNLRRETPFIETDSKPIIIKKVIGKYIQNKKCIEAIASSYGVIPIFIWQPVSVYKYTSTYAPFFNSFIKGPIHHFSLSSYGYPIMAEYLKENPLDKNFIWCADIQAEIDTLLYLDRAHYTAEMSKKFAYHICNILLERGLFRAEKKVPQNK